MSLSITVLGCSGSYAAPGGACSGYLVRSDSTAIWLDTGPGTLANVQQHIDLGDIDAIVVSHEHPDHCGELAVLYNAFRWYIERSDVLVLATTGVEKVVRVSCGPTDDVFDWKFLSSGAAHSVGDINLTFERTAHTVETMAVRCEHDGEVIVYSSDTGPGWDMGTFASEADILVGEGTLLHADRHDDIPHISAKQLGDHARSGAVRRLVVTHISPGADEQAHVDEASAAFGAEAELAQVHRVFTV